jgi:uncharacterized protein YciI
MFIISVTYLQPIEVVENHLPAHVAFLDDYIAKGIFVAAGRKVPRTGGFILAGNVGKTEIEAILEKDPFKVNGVASYDVTEFAPNRTAPEFAALLDL